ISLYGTRAESILALAAVDTELRERIAPAYPDIRAQIRYAIQEEMVCSAADFLLRRTGIGYTANQGEDALATVSHALGAQLGWSSEQELADQQAYAAQLAHDHAIC
ncbi:MAG TPA: glycerol-3-phosphate dehydrogenase C-terminal domain-containing protein, partial [Armatimonadota bacterium]|nr:glycerol-3-phosphate dehydrogenase C-terminal domain-containing protein [Armatimonadota bacterium]